SDYFSPVHVNHLLVEQIAFQQEKTLDSLARGPISNRALCANATVDPAYGSERQGPISFPGLDDQRRNLSSIFLWRQCNLAYTSTTHAIGVIDRRAEQFRQCERVVHLSEEYSTMQHEAR